MAETFQARGSRARYQYALESDWGVVNGSPNWRRVRLIPGETLDGNRETYRSREIREDRMRNATVRGSQKPAGNLPFELSPRGWNPFWWHLLGGSVTTTGPTGGLTTPAAPTGTAQTTGGTLAAATYHYKITALNALGETLPGAASAPVTTTGSTGRVDLAWSAVAGATGYRIYGRPATSGGTYLFIAQVGAVLAYSDTGAITPAGAVPAVDTTGAVYTHVIKGSVSLPTGFTLEKGFLDAALFLPFYGCRVAKATLDYNIDNIAGGVFELMAREEGALSGTSLNTGAAPNQPVERPFTSAQCQIYEGDSLTLLGTGRELKLEVDNNFYGDRGYIIGDTLRQNLLPGDRVTQLGGKFMFKDGTLYNKAIGGTNTKARILSTNGTYGVQFDLPLFQFLPMNTTPKAGDDGPIEIEAKGEALPDPFEGTDIVCTIKTNEAVITN